MDDRGKVGYYNKPDNRELKPATLMQVAEIQEWILDKQEIPTIKDVMKLTGYKYDYAGELRRIAIRDFPRVDIEELVEEVKYQLMKRIKIGEIETTDLIKLMPWVAEQRGSKTDIKQEITHRFIVLKPDELPPVE